MCLALLYTVAGLARADESASMKPENFVIRYANALAAQEWEEVDPLIHPDCTVTFSNGSCHQGKERVRDAFQKNFDLIEDEIYSISDLHWVIQGETFAVFTYSYFWSGTINGEKASGAGRGTSTIIRENGTWRLISEHLGPGS